MSGTLSTDDIHAFTPGSVAPVAAQALKKPPRRVWPWVLGGFVLLALLITAGTVAALLALVGEAREGLHVIVDGQPWGWIGGDWAGDVMTAVALGAGALVLVLLVGVPLVVLFGLVVGGLGVVVALALAAAGVGLALAVLLSPLWLLVLLLWLLLRPRRSPADARMNA